MITLRKLASLNRETRLRKTARLCREISLDLLRGGIPDLIFIHGLGSIIAGEELPGEVLRGGKTLASWKKDIPVEELIRHIDNLHYNLSRHMGITPGDWDLKDPEGELSRENRLVRPFRVYLDDIRSPFNVGSIFRTAEAFGVEKIFFSPSTPPPDHPRAGRTAMGCDRIIPWKNGGLELLESEPAVFALELGGEDIGKFDFPESGTVILGSEELGLSPAARQLVTGRNGIVSIPMLGAKGSINVSVAFGILMYAWNRSRGNY